MGVKGVAATGPVQAGVGWRAVTMKAGAQPNYDVNRASGIDRDNGCWLRRLRCQVQVDWITFMNEKTVAHKNWPPQISYSYASKSKVSAARMEPEASDRKS